MALVNFTNLDFDQIKTSIKDYLRSNSNFTDYDFEGSTLSTLIDVLAYNTYITSYNANMVSNEVFIDSATLRENVVSLARNIGYVPRSKTSATANISFFVDTTGLSTNPITLTLKSGVVCTSSSTFGSESYSFTIPSNITVPVVNGIALFENINVYEGTFITQNFTVDSNNQNQKFILDNANIDIKSISVLVRENASSTKYNKYNLSENLFNVGPRSKVFFIQEIEDQRYELIFGDGVFGRKLDNANFIEVSYVITNGEDGNGVSSFAYSGRIVDNNNRVVTSGISLLSTNSISRGGMNLESVDSIKKYAPRIYASQNRAVTSSDYEAIVAKLYPETESLSVYGGEELDPPKFGRVYISIKPINSAFVSRQIKDNIKNSLRNYSVAGIVPEIIDLKYLYIEFSSSVYYNQNLSPSSNFVRNLVSDNIVSYAKSSELNKFGSRFKYSKFLKLIDDSHESITSNITKIAMRRDLKPNLNQFATYEICFGNAFHVGKTEGYNIKTSGFRLSSISDVIYMSDKPNLDKRTGSLFFFKLNESGNPVIVKNNVGRVDYEKGEIIINPVNITSTSKSFGEEFYIEISIPPKSNDVIGLQDLYIQLDASNSILNMISDEISSGASISGSNYIVTSSYFNGDLVRK